MHSGVGAIQLVEEVALQAAVSSTFCCIIGARTDGSPPVTSVARQLQQGCSCQAHGQHARFCDARAPCAASARAAAAECQARKQESAARCAYSMLGALINVVVMPRQRSKCYDDYLLPLPVVTYLLQCKQWQLWLRTAPACNRRQQRVRLFAVESMMAFYFNKL